MGLSLDIIGALPMAAKSDMVLEALKAHSGSFAPEIVLKSGLPPEDFIAALKYVLRGSPQCITAHGGFNPGLARIELEFMGYKVPPEMLELLNNHCKTRATATLLGVQTGLEIQIGVLLQEPAAAQCAQATHQALAPMRYIPDSNAIRHAVFHHPEPVLLPHQAHARQPTRMHFAPDPSAALQLTYTPKVATVAQAVVATAAGVRPIDAAPCGQPLDILNALTTRPAILPPTSNIHTTPNYFSPKPGAPLQLGYTPKIAAVEQAIVMRSAKRIHTAPASPLFEGSKFAKSKWALVAGGVLALGAVAYLALRRDSSELPSVDRT